MSPCFSANWVLNSLDLCLKTGYLRAASNAHWGLFSNQQPKIVHQIIRVDIDNQAYGIPCAIKAVKASQRKKTIFSV